MASWDDVSRLALALPETSVRDGSTSQWRVNDKLFVWERLLRAKDLEALGLDEQPGPVLGVRTADLGEKAALIAQDPDVYFATPHFDNYSAVLVRLDRIDVAGLDELVEQAWLSRAPKRVVAQYLAEHE